MSLRQSLTASVMLTLQVLELGKEMWTQDIGQTDHVRATKDIAEQLTSTAIYVTAPQL